MTRTAMRNEAYCLAHDAVTVKRSGLPAPILSYDTAASVWRLEESYAFYDQGYAITIPEGFEFDLSSVPRPFWGLIAPFELSIVAPLVHDFLYRYRGRPPEATVSPPRTFTRAEADRVFRHVMQREGVPWWRWWLAYAAVRLFGAWAWHRRVP